MARQDQWARPRSLDCAGCTTCASSEWSVLNPTQVAELNASKVTRYYQSGEHIYFQGNPCPGLYCIESGTIAIRQSDPDGKTKMLRTVTVGQTLGYSDYFAGKVFRGNAVCLDRATVCLVPSHTLQKLLTASPALGLAFLSHCAEDLQNADVMGMQQALSPVRVRVVHLLLKFKDQFGVSDDTGSICMSLPMSWVEAAELVGARAETVSRAVHDLAENNIIRIRGRKVTIPDLDLLLDVVEQSAG